MKINRFVALSAIALLVVGALGTAGTLVFAQTARQAASAQVRSAQAVATQPPATQAVVTQPPATQAPATQAPEATESAVGATEAPSIGSTDPITGTEETDTGGDQQSPSYTGSITVTEAATGQLSDANEAAALAAQAKITVEQAKTAALAANAGTTVVSSSLDAENGTLVFSVELSNGSDVKVDAGNGKILATDTGGASELGGEAGGSATDGGATETGSTDPAGDPNNGVGSQVQQP